MRDLAKAAKLNIILTDDESLDLVTTKIHTAMHDWVMWERLKGKVMRRSPTLAWVESMDGWLEDGIVMLGGIPESARHGWVKENPALMGGALALLMRALPPGAANSPEQRRLAAALRQAGVMDGDATISYKTMERLLHTILGSLGVLRALAPGLKRSALNLPNRTGKSHNRELLMEQLSCCFQQLHGRRYTITTPNPASYPSAPPGGAALDWTRGLFHLIADRAEAKQVGSSAEEFPEFRNLAMWVDQPHAAAELIKPTDYWQQEATKRKSRAGRRGN